MTVETVISSEPGALLFRLRTRINMSKLLLGTIAILALMTQTSAAPIAQCVMKSYAEVKSLPSSSGRVILSVPNELRVHVLEEFGTQWVWVASTDSEKSCRRLGASLVLEILLGTGTVPKVKPQSLFPGWTPFPIVRHP
jgi:hypothetical protein